MSEVKSVTIIEINPPYYIQPIDGLNSGILSFNIRASDIYFKNRTTNEKIQFESYPYLDERLPFGNGLVIFETYEMPGNKLKVFMRLDRDANAIIGGNLGLYEEHDLYAGKVIYDITYLHKQIQ